METNGTVIGEVDVQVKAGLYVDQKTADICMDLLGIYLKNQGYVGALIRFDENMPHPMVDAIREHKDMAYLVSALSVRQQED